MKNFVKKLSFVLAAAMVVTSVAVPVSASAATKGVTARYAGQKKSSTVVTSKTIWAGGKKVNFDYVYGKKTSGVKGTWTSSDPSVVTVDSATGKATALKKGDVTVTFTPKSKKYAAVKVAVKARVRATSIILHDGADRTAPVVTNAALKVGESKTYYAELRTKTGTKSSYFVKAATSNASAAAVKNGAEDGSYKGDNYGRNVTVTANATGSSVVTLVASPYSDDRTSTYDVKAEFPVTVKTVVSTSPVYQTEAKEITVSGVASGTSLVVVAGDQFVSTRQNIAVLSTKANADGTNDVVLKLKDGITPNLKYTVFTAAGVKVGEFVGESEKVASIKLDDSYVKINDSNKKQAIAKVKLTNQWGNPFKGGTTTITTVVATGTGSVNENDGVNAAKNSNYADDKSEVGAYYFLLDTAKNQYNAKKNKYETVEFADGDTVDVTVVTTNRNEKYVQTATLTVKGTASVSKTSLYKISFNGDNKEADDGHVFTADDIKDSDSKSHINFTGFVAFAAGKAVKPEKGDFTAYVDGDKTKTYEVTVGEADELLSTNGVYKKADVSTWGNAEYKFTVGLQSQDLKAGKHTLTVEYKDAKLTADFELLADSKAYAAPSKTTAVKLNSLTVSLPKIQPEESYYNWARTEVAVSGVSGTNFDEHTYYGYVNVKAPTTDLTVKGTGFKVDDSGNLFELKVNINKDKKASIASSTKLFVSPKAEEVKAENIGHEWVDAEVDGNSVKFIKYEIVPDRDGGAKLKTTTYFYDITKWTNSSNS